MKIIILGFITRTILQTSHKFHVVSDTNMQSHIFFYLLPFIESNSLTMRMEDTCTLFKKNQHELFQGTQNNTLYS